MPKAQTREDILDLFATAIHSLKEENAGVWTTLDLTMPQVKVLMILHKEGSAPVGKIAERLGVKMPNVTWILDRLVERGLVERETDPDDRRVVRSRLTDEGRARITTFFEARTERLRKALARLTDEEGRALRTGMKALCSAILEERKGV